MEMPDGWYPDPTGRHQLRRWEGGRWGDWVSTGGQVGADPMPEPPASGGGTLTTEPVINATRAGLSWSLSSLYGHPLATAVVEGRTATVSEPSGTPTHQLRRSVAGSMTVVSLHDRTDREVGRFEEVRRAYLGGFRVVGVGALLATLDAQTNDLRRLVLVDPGGIPLGRMAEEGGRWTTELAHPFG
ncbi:MAG: hypothetical protein ABIS47_00975, partial [Acidimicrobiales bacterium]